MAQAPKKVVRPVFTTSPVHAQDAHGVVENRHRFLLELQQRSWLRTNQLLQWKRVRMHGMACRVAILFRCVLEGLAVQARQSRTYSPYIFRLLYGFTFLENEAFLLQKICSGVIV